MRGWTGLNFDEGKEAGWPFLAGIVLLDIGLITFVNLVVFARGWLDFLPVLTRGWLDATLAANVPLFALIVGFLFPVAGKLVSRDVGLDLRKLPEALIVTFGLWLAMQVIVGGMSLLAGHRLAMHPAWAGSGSILMGGLIGQLAGNALLEETVFRGFLLKQLYRKMKRKPGGRAGWTLGFAMVASQLVFAFMHVPNRLFYGVPLAQIFLQIPVLFALGVVFALVYVRTGNLFIAVGVHALCNAPTFLFAGKEAYAAFYYGLALLLIAFWPAFSKAVNRPLRKGGEPTVRRSES